MLTISKTVVNEQLLHDLTEAQRVHTIDQINRKLPYGDDSTFYAIDALELMWVMLRLWYARDLEGLSELLSMDQDAPLKLKSVKPLRAYHGDSVARAFYAHPWLQTRDAAEAVN